MDDGGPKTPYSSLLPQLQPGRQMPGSASGTTTSQSSNQGCSYLECLQLDCLQHSILTGGTALLSAVSSYWQHVLTAAGAAAAAGPTCAESEPTSSLSNRAMARTPVSSEQCSNTYSKMRRGNTPYSFEASEVHH